MECEIGFKSDTLYKIAKGDKTSFLGEYRQERIQIISRIYSAQIHKKQKK